MPRLDYRAGPEQVLQHYESRLLLSVFVRELNQLRRLAGQPELGPHDIHALLRDYVRAHPRGSRPSGEETS